MSLLTVVHMVYHSPSHERMTQRAVPGWSFVLFPLLHLAPSGRTLLISDVPDASPTASSHPQVCQRELCHGLSPIPVSSSSWRAPTAWTIAPTLDHLNLVIDHAVTRIPPLPEHHPPAATRTS